MKEKETISFIPNKKREERIKKLIKEGYRWKCMDCGTIYKDKPEQPYEDGHSGRSIEMCRCGSDLFVSLQEVLEKCFVVIKVEPKIDGTIVLKEHNFKHCQCEKGEVWTGDAGTECWAKFDLLVVYSDRKVFRCLRSGHRIVCLKSTKEELKNAGYLRIPEDCRMP